MTNGRMIFFIEKVYYYVFFYAFKNLDTVIYLKYLKVVDLKIYCL